MLLKKKDAKFDSSFLPVEVSNKETILKNYDDQIKREQDIMISVPSILKDKEKNFKIKVMKITSFLFHEFIYLYFFIAKDKERTILLQHFRDSITKSFLANLKILKESPSKILV